jgi:predicted phosphoribosyltransferase
MTPHSAPYRDRHHAGQVLATHLMHHRGQEGLLVLALPRGGVAVGYEVARALQAPLDIFVVRKVGLPDHEEYAIGAIASGDVRVMNPLLGHHLDPAALDAAVAKAQRELRRREQLYRDQRSAQPLRDRFVIVVDDGLATGSTMRAALKAIRQQHPAHLTVAVPVGPANTCMGLSDLADEVVCVWMPSPFHAVGLWYQNFPQASDDEVRMLLAQADRAHALDLAAGGTT